MKDSRCAHGGCGGLVVWVIVFKSFDLSGRLFHPFVATQRRQARASPTGGAPAGIANA